MVRILDGMIPQETANRILDTAQIVDVISDFVTLKRRGGNYVACCPFHNEKTPSFSVSPSRGIYKCFGCGKAGSAVGFVMEYEHLSYAEALRYLAKKYNIEIVEKEETAEEIARRQRNESLLLVSEFAGKFFADSLRGDEGRTIGLAYFRSRGLEDRTIEKYGLGWAPKSRHALSDAAKKAGYKEEYLTETGLCVAGDGNGGIYDRFYDRVMFPIHSVSGRIIAFGGRTLRTDKTVAKYVNSKESEIYVKSRSLYGIYFAKNEIARQDKCLLVEGYLDVLSLHQLGIVNAVASSGTSLTVEQIRLIKKFTENVTIMYDGDSAGIHAALRGIDLILKEGMNVKIVLIPDGDDPDSYSRKHTLDEVRTFISDNERDFIEFKTDLLLEEVGNDPLKKAALINDIADTIARIPDAVKRSVYVDSCSRRFNIESRILFDRIRTTREKMLAEERQEHGRTEWRPEPQPVRQEEVQAPEQSGQPSAMRLLENDAILAPSEKELLSFILAYGRSPLEFERDSEYYSGEDRASVADFIDDALAADNAAFVNDVYREVYDAYFRLYDAGLSQEQIIKSLLDDENRTTAFIAAELSEEKYLLTVKNFSDAMMTRASWLVKFVPRSILAYQEKKTRAMIRELTLSLSSAEGDEQVKIMQDINRINQIRQEINKRLGREKTDRQ